MNMILPAPWLAALALAVVICAVILIRQMRQELSEDLQPVQRTSAPSQESVISIEKQEGLPLPVLLAAVSAYMAETEDNI